MLLLEARREVEAGPEDECDCLSRQQQPVNPSPTYRRVFGDERISNGGSKTAARVSERIEESTEEITILHWYEFADDIVEGHLSSCADAEKNVSSCASVSYYYQVSIDDQNLPISAGMDLAVAQTMLPTTPKMPPAIKK